MGSAYFRPRPALARRGFAHAFDEIERPEPPAGIGPPGPGGQTRRRAGRTTAPGNARSPSCARPVRHVFHGGPWSVHS
jgi:hypothetical protein